MHAKHVLKITSKWFVKFGVFIIMLLITTITLTLILAHNPNSSKNIHLFFNEYRDYFAFIRWGTIALIMGLWPAIIKWYGKQKALDKNHVTRLIQARWRIATWLIIIEVMLGTSLPAIATNYVIEWFS